MTFIPFNPPGVTKAYADTLYAALSHTHAASAIVSGVLDNARVNWAAPDAIGGTTPAAGTFTTLSANSTVSVTNPAGVSQPVTFYDQNGVAVYQFGLFAAVSGNAGILTLNGPSGQGTGAGFNFTSNGGSRTGSFQLDSSGNYVFRQGAAGAMYFDYNSSVNFRAASGGSQRASLSSAGLFSVAATDAVTNATTDILTLGHNSSGTPAASFGAGLAFQLESSTTENRDAALISAAWTTATDASRASDLVASAYYTTTKREGVRIRGGSANAQIGFLGATPVSRASHIADPSGGGTQDAEARTAINAILVVLENLGFVATS